MFLGSLRLLLGNVVMISSIFKFHHVKKSLKMNIKCFSIIRLELARALITLAPAPTSDEIQKKTLSHVVDTCNKALLE
jgi:hypothetical protein